MSGDKIAVHRDGEIIGHYIVKGGMITVYSPNGHSRTTRQSGAGDNAGLARLMLSEAWAR
ncbi:hypothetical protein GLI01_23720 [Gluconacetobacter liquefaciens]|nr:hypothetical protein AA0522_2081 [Gluconacetobacter liquefaciens NRIC 0522]GEB38337.1 hypothetical protein GLI01_23720 [Gluconacetobacter liquefaciens]